jgi:predicted XRE-type DNA-binding protein
METITESSGNVFADLGFSAEESALLAMRADLMARLRETIAERDWTQMEAASHLVIGQFRSSDLTPA